MIPATPENTAQNAKSPPGGDSDRISTKPAISSSPTPCEARSTLSTGRRRLLRPPRKSATPHETLEAKASASAVTTAHGSQPCASI